MDGDEFDNRIYDLHCSLDMFVHFPGCISNPKHTEPDDDSYSYLDNFLAFRSNTSRDFDSALQAVDLTSSGVQYQSSNSNDADS